MLQNILPLYLDGQTEPAPQDQVSMAASKEPSYSRKLTKDDGILDWSKPAAQLEREVRAYIEWPKSRTELAGKEVVITKAHVVDQALNPGQTHIEAKQLIIGAGKQSLSIDKLKPAGKQEMDIQGFLAGYSKNL